MYSLDIIKINPIIKDNLVDKFIFGINIIIDNFELSIEFEKVPEIKKPISEWTQQDIYNIILSYVSDNYDTFVSDINKLKQDPIFRRIK